MSTAMDDTRDRFPFGTDPPPDELALQRQTAQVQREQAAKRAAKGLYQVMDVADEWNNALPEADILPIEITPARVEVKGGITTLYKDLPITETEEYKAAVEALGAMDTYMLKHVRPLLDMIKARGL